MITAIENCLTSTCGDIGIQSTEVFPADDLPTLSDPLKSYAQFQFMDSIYSPVNPSIERKITSATETTVKTPRSRINLTVRLGLIHDIRSTVENLGIDFIKNLPKLITWDSDTDIEIRITPKQATRGEIDQTYKELAIYLEFDSIIYKVDPPTEKVITIINEIGQTYDGNDITQ